MPTAAQTTWSANGRLDPMFRPERLSILHVQLPASVTLTRGTVLGEITASPGTYKAYANGNVDGSQVAKGILQYSVSTDASGNITMIGEHGLTQKSVPMIMPSGAIFKCAELSGLDAAAVTDFGAALIEGDITSGLIRI